MRAVARLILDLEQMLIMKVNGDNWCERQGAQQDRVDPKVGPMPASLRKPKRHEGNK